MVYPLMSLERLVRSEHAASPASKYLPKQSPRKIAMHCCIITTKSVAFSHSVMIYIEKKQMDPQRCSSKNHE